jgi:hypothetical protein
MKKEIITLIFFAFTLSINAQVTDYSIIDNKRDYNWTMGIIGALSSGQTRGIHMHFDSIEGLNQISNPEIPMTFKRTNASISNTEGNLLFSFNGHEIMDNSYQIAINGTDINPEGEGESWWWSSGYPVTQGAIILPDFNDSTLYHLFHLQADFDETLSPPQSTCNAFLHTQIVKTSLNGMAEVTEKNIPIIEDERLMRGKLTATRHANGRDWWIPIFYFNERSYQHLFTPDGLIDYGLHEVDLTVFQSLGQGQFSPDGTTYMQHNGYSGNGVFVDIFDFDRCTGELSNQRQWMYQTPNNLSWGAAISPNSRFLYLSQGEYMLQADLQAEDIFSSIDTVGIYEEFIDPFHATFFAGQLAPDGKIYFCAPNGLYHLHVIHNPNEQGEACNFEQHGIPLPAGNNYSIPNFPNFRLGRLEGSDCDTLYSSNTSVYDIEPVFSVFPNPARDVLEISWEVDGFQTMDVRVLDMLGREVVFSRGNGSGMRLDVSGWAVGMYVLQLESKGQVLTVEKIVVQR